MTARPPRYQRYSLVDLGVWEGIRRRLPLPLEEDEAITDLRALARVAVAQGMPLGALPYGRRALAKRWGWPGVAGEQRVRRLVGPSLAELAQKHGPRARPRWWDPQLDKL